MEFNKKDVLNLSLLFILIIFILWNTFNNPFIGGTNDLEMQSYHLWYLSYSIKEFNTLPTWTPDLFGGKPFLGLYQPLTYFIFLPISLLFNPVTVPKIAIFLVTLFSTFFFYLLAKKLFKDNLTILLSTALFTVFPNRLAMTNGGTLAELTAVTFIPLIFLFYEKIKEKISLTNLSIFGLLIGFTLLTHHAVGGTVIGAIILFGLYDYFIENNKNITKTIPFLIAGILMSLVFLIPAYQIQETLNFGVTEQAGKEFRPLEYKSFFIRADSHGGGEFIGITAFIALLSSLLLLKNKDNLRKYIIISFVLLLLGLHLYFLIPGFIKGTLQGAHRFFSVLSVTMSISIVIGLKELIKYLTKYINEFNILKIKQDQETKIKTALFIAIILIITISQIQFKPSSENFLDIPNGVVKFYEEVSKDNEYFRIEDQQFSPFGFTPILHKHGSLNGAPMQEAPKYHFFFWSNSWKLLQNQIGAENFAGLYGTLSIKYFLTGSPANIPYFKEIKCGNKYCIYENQQFLPYVRIVANILKIDIKEPEQGLALLELASKNIIPFDKIAFLHGNYGKDNLKSEEIKDPNAKINILEQKPGYLKIEINNIQNEEYLIIAESYHPYWIATQNNKELTIYEGIPSTLIIPIKENGIIEVKYQIPKLKIYLFYLTLLIIAILISLIIYDYKNDKRKHK